MEKRLMIGTCEFRCGGTLLETTPVYEGESPDSDVIFHRAMRAMEVLDPTRARLLYQCERRYGSARRITHGQ